MLENKELRRIFILFSGLFKKALSSWSIQNVPGGNINILGGHSIGHSKQKCTYVHVSYSERFRR
jgi:hypothetical protein